MLDTLLTVAMLSLPPARPAMVRTPALVAPAAVRPAVVQVASVQSPELSTTCYLATSESCWTGGN